MSDDLLARIKQLEAAVIDLTAACEELLDVEIYDGRYGLDKLRELSEYDELTDKVEAIIKKYKNKT